MSTAKLVYICDTRPDEAMMFEFSQLLGSCWATISKTRVQFRRQQGCLTRHEMKWHQIKTCRCVKQNLAIIIKLCSETWCCPQNRCDKTYKVGRRMEVTFCVLIPAFPIQVYHEIWDWQRRFQPLVRLARRIPLPCGKINQIRWHISMSIWNGCA